MKSYYFILFLIALTACHSTKKMTNVKSQPSNTIHDLNGTWILTYISGPKKTFDAFYPNQKPEITFDVNNHKISGFTGCNSFGGQFGYDKDKLDFTKPFEQTEKYCKGGGEALFNETLEKIDGFSIRNDSLFLKMSSLEMMQFYRK